MSPTANTSPSKSATTKTAPKRTAGTAAKKSTSKASTGAAATGARSPRAKARSNPGTIGAVGTYAERAVLIPVGAALIAGDKLAAGVSDLPRDPSTANAKAQAQLRKFERRGTSARNSLEREARRTRVRLERELRKRRGELDRAVSDLDRHRSSLTSKVQDRLPGAVRSRKAA
jgi:hypothetical protein